MKIAVWDTHVTRKDGKVMHFDILVDVMQEGQNLSSKECVFCHIDKAPVEVEKQIIKSGFAIIEMENCY